MKQVAGLINQSISIYKYIDVANDSGGTDPMEVVYWSTSAEVKMLKASRNLESNQEKLKPVAIFKVRYRNDKFLIADMNIKWRGEIFTIIDCEIDYVYKDYLIIRATSGKAPVR